MTFVHRTWRLGLVAGLLLAIAAIGPAFAATAGVDIVGKTFAPAELTVAPGDTVTWTVKESNGEPHTVTATAVDGAPSAFDSSKDDPDLTKLKDNGGTFSFTFETPGTYAYVCTVHATEMKGTITVAAAGEEPGHGGEPVPTERKVLGGAILVVTLIVLFVAAWFYRRMNPA